MLNPSVFRLTLTHLKYLTLHGLNLVFNTHGTSITFRLLTSAKNIQVECSFCSLGMHVTPVNFTSLNLTQPIASSPTIDLRLSHLSIAILADTTVSCCGTDRDIVAHEVFVHGYSHCSLSGPRSV